VTVSVVGRSRVLVTVVRKVLQLVVEVRAGAASSIGEARIVALGKS